MNEPARATTPSPLTVPTLAAAAAFLLFLLPGVLGPYGFFIDELYYIACSKHLAWGYVDHPPLAPALLWASRGLLGDTIWALRVPAALLGALTTWLAAALARRLGAGAFGQWVAAGAVMTATVLQILFGMFTVNALEIAIWLGCCWLLIEIEERDEPRLWLAFGALAGIGLLDKHTLVLLAVGLAVALPLTRARRHLASPWLWAGAALALLIASPNLLWQQAHGWPSLEFYRNASLYKNQPTPPWAVLLFQALTMNPGTLPVWLAGLGFFLFATRGRRLRHVGLLFVVLLAALALGRQSRPDRLAGMYPVLFAAGAAFLDRWSAGEGRCWLRWALPAWMLLCGALFLPLGEPVLPPARLADYAATLGVVPKIERGEGKDSELPQWFADRLGWPELAADVDRALAEAAFEPGEELAVFAPSYGQAGALELLHAGPGFPPVYSAHNNYYLWGPPPDTVDAGLVLGSSEEELSELFGRVDLLAVHDCPYCMRWRDDMPIWRVESPRVSLARAWPRFKHFE